MTSFFIYPFLSDKSTRNLITFLHWQQNSNLISLQNAAQIRRFVKNLKFVQERRDGREVFAFGDQLSFEGDAGFCAEGAFEPCAEHFLALCAVLDANLHGIVASC